MKYENKSLCSKCGGMCCKNGPCFFMPDDFSDLSLEGLKKEFSKKDYLCICLTDIPFISIRLDFWEKVVRPTTYFLGGPCPLLTETGCPFSYDERPTSAKMLVPLPNNQCELILFPNMVDLAWEPYKETLLQLATMI